MIVKKPFMLTGRIPFAGSVNIRCDGSEYSESARDAFHLAQVQLTDASSFLQLFRCELQAHFLRDSQDLFLTLVRRTLQQCFIFLYFY